MQSINAQDLQAIQGSHVNKRYWAQGETIWLIRKSYNPQNRKWTKHGIVVKSRLLQSMEGWDSPFWQINSKIKNILLGNVRQIPGDLVIKMLTEVAISTTEEEIIEMNKGLRTVIPLMSLIEEKEEQNVGRFGTHTKVQCKVFKDILDAMKIFQCFM